MHAIGEGVAELLWPTRCVLCDVPGTLLCDGCRLEISYIDPLRACPHCGHANGKLACINCNSFIVEHRGMVKGADPFEQVVSTFEFVDPCRKLITVYKDRKEIRLAAVLASLLIEYIDPDWIVPGDTALVVIPARKEALRARGFDHMKEVGRHLARLSGLALLDLLEVNERGDQRGLSASSRQRNMRDSFLPKIPAYAASAPNALASMPRMDGAIATASVLDDPIYAVSSCTRLPERIILVDDVFTTGATLTAAAVTLKGMGIKKVFGLTVARLP